MIIMGHYPDWKFFSNLTTSGGWGALKILKFVYGQAGSKDMKHAKTTSVHLTLIINLKTFISPIKMKIVTYLLHKFRDARYLHTVLMMMIVELAT